MTYSCASGIAGPWTCDDTWRKWAIKLRFRRTRVHSTTSRERLARTNACPVGSVVLWRWHTTPKTSSASTSTTTGSSCTPGDQSPLVSSVFLNVKGFEVLTSWVLVESPADWLLDRMTGRLDGWLTCWLADWWAGWLARWLVDWLVGRMTGWLASWLAGCLVFWLAGWLIGCGTGWLFGWLVVWLVGNLAGW